MLDHQRTRTIKGYNRSYLLLFIIMYFSLYLSCVSKRVLDMFGKLSDIISFADKCVDNQVRL